MCVDQDKKTLKTRQEFVRRILSHKKNIITVTFGQLLCAAGAAVGIRLLTEFASPETFGNYKLIVGIIALISGVIFRPISQFAMREYHDSLLSGKEDIFSRFIRSAFIKFAIISAVLTTLGLWAIRFVSLNIGGLLCIGGGIFLLGDALLTFESSLLTTKNRQLSVMLLRIGKSCGMPIVGVAAILAFGDSSEALLLSAALFTGSIGFPLSIYPSFSRAYRQINWHKLDTHVWKKNAKSFVTPLAVVGILSWITAVADRYILAYFGDSSAVGIYSATYGLVSFPILTAGTILAQLSFPLIFGATSQGNAASQRRMYLVLALLSTLIAFFATAFVFVFGKYMALLFLGEEFRKGAPALMNWIAAGYGMLIIAHACDIKSYAQKRTLLMTIAYGLAAAANIALNLLWIPRLGGLGAAQATCVSHGVYLCVMLCGNYRMLRLV